MSILIAVVIRTLDDMDVNALCHVLLIIFGGLQRLQGTANNAVNYQLMFNPTPMSWIGAATWCRIKDGDLVTVDSESIVLMINWFKSNAWNTSWNNHVWSGLYFYSSAGYWLGTCESLNYTFWEETQIFNLSAPCIYMRKTDLRWNFDDCTHHYNVICQIPSGNCTFDDQNMEVDKSLASLPDVTANTLSDCKVLCDHYRQGLAQCWALKYQASAYKCNLYVSVYPAEYLSTKPNSNPNLFYSTRNCFDESIVIESEPATSANISSIIDVCLSPTTPSLTQSTITATTDSVVTISPTTLYTCDFKCPCDFTSPDITTQMLQERVNELKRILQIDKTETNAYVRKHTSAHDNRRSSQAIGTVGALFIAFCLFSIVCIDVFNIFQHINCKRFKHSSIMKRKDATYLKKVNIFYVDK